MNNVDSHKTLERGLPLLGRKVAFLESRRGDELAQMIERAGGIPYRAPALREVPAENGVIDRWLEPATAGVFDVVIFLSGVGCDMLFDRATQLDALSALKAALVHTQVVARGPKPVRVLKQQGVRIDFVPPEPNTSDELLAELANWNLDRKAIGLQVYGGTTPFLERLRGGLASLGAHVAEVSPYRWDGPSNEGPVCALIAACLDGRIDALLILSSSQIHNLFAVAEEHGHDQELRRALNDRRVIIAAVGPVSAQATEAQGVTVDLQPEHPKMGHLVKELGQFWNENRSSFD